MRKGEEKPFDECAEIDFFSGVEFRAGEFDGGHFKKWKVISEKKV
jgi:hypothetical protein